LYQKNFSEYQLINPTITSFKHGDHQNGDSNLLENQMTVQFETVKKPKEITKVIELHNVYKSFDNKNVINGHLAFQLT